MERPPRLNEIKNGLLVFRIKWDQIPKGYSDRPNCHHVGVIIESDVVQSNESTGVNRKPYNVNEWVGCGWMKFIDFPISENAIPPEENEISYNDVYTQPGELTDHEMIKAIYNHLIVD